MKTNKEIDICPRVLVPVPFDPETPEENQIDTCPGMTCKDFIKKYGIRLGTDKWNQVKENRRIAGINRKLCDDL